ncbi:hypothetical protein [Streptomyces sioyaensis]|uniref:hypothetical protein n=1 Tax=Streptomyces sioyaensis TaxID=67364 RepID=UPI0036E847DF
MDDEMEVDRTLEELIELRCDVVAGQRDQKAAIAELESDVDAVGTELLRVRTEIETLSRDVSLVASDTRELVASFDRFTERYARDQVRAAAEAELTQLTLQWHNRFEERRRTRALARGLVHALTRDALDRGMVDTATVETCAEERMLMEPSFWLAPAVVALASRHRDQPERARRARSQAYSLDPARSNLFFALTCSRLGELSEAARWMDRYLHSLDPYALDEDFPIVLDAIAANELGHEAHSYARQAMTRWAAQLDLAQSVTVSDPVADNVRKLRHRLPEDSFTELERLCTPEWDQLRRGWELASVPTAALNYFQDQFPGGTSPENGSDKHADSALDSLIERFDPEERALDDRMKYLRLVIEHAGDRDKALLIHKERVTAQEPADLETLLVNAVFVADGVRLGDEARLFVLRILWPGVVRAALACADRARQLLPHSLGIQVQEWNGVVPADPSVAVDPEPLVAELAGDIHERTHRRIEAVHLNRIRLVAAGILVPLWCGLAMTVDAGLARVVYGTLCVLCVGWSVYEWGRVPARRQELRREGSLMALRSEELLRSGLEQRRHFFAAWIANLRDSSELTAWGAGTWGNEPGVLGSGDGKGRTE